MTLVWVLRILLYIQLLLGLARLFPATIGATGLVAIMHTHLALGIVITIVAPLALAPRANVPELAPRKLARIAPLAPLLVGLAIRFGGIGSGLWTIVHIVLGLTTIALVEIAAARQRRALRLNT